MTQKDFERLSELMARKGVIHEAFELLADLRQSEQLAKEEVQSIENSVIDALKGFVDFEGFNPSEINYLQVVRKIKAQLTWRPASELPGEGQIVIATYLNCYGKRRRVRAVYIRQYEEEAGDDDELCVEYCEERDEWYLKEGWYELVDNWPDYSSIAVHEGEVDYWMPMPPAPEGE